MTYGPTNIVRDQLTASVIQIEREKTMGSSQSQPGCAPKSATSGSEPSAAFTPGPWSVLDCRETWDELWIEAAHPDVGAVSHASVRYGCEEAEELGNIEANARLIAAAPTMLDALQAIADESVFNQQRFAEDDDADYFLRCFRAVKERARAAIAKALHPSAADTSGENDLARDDDK